MRARVNLKGLFTFSFSGIFLPRHSTSSVYKNVQNFGGRLILSSEVKRSQCSCVVFLYQFKNLQKKITVFSNQIKGKKINHKKS